MNTKAKIVVSGCAGIMLLIALRGINQPRLYMTPEEVLHYEHEFTNHIKPTRIFKEFNQTNMESPTNLAGQTVTIHYDLRGPKEAELIDKMNLVLLGLGQQRDERTVRQVVLARIKGDWSKTPPGPDWADNEKWQRDSSELLKRKIGFLLPSGTNADGKLIPADALTIKRVLECDLGPTVPPMEDFEVHE